MKIVVTGSLGHISRPLATALIQKGHSVTVVSSTAERQSTIESLGAKAAIGTMDDADFLSATFKGADIVYVMETLGPNSFFDKNLDVIAAISQIGHNYQQAIQQSGVKRVVHLSSIGAHMDKGNGILVFHYNVETILKQLPNDVAIKFMRPVGFYYNMLAFIRTIKTQGAIISNYGGDEKEPWVSPLDIAAAIAEEIEQPFEGRKVRYIASDEVSPNEVAKVLGEAIGKPDLKWLVIPDEQLLNGMIASGMNPQTAKGFVEMNAARRGGVLYEDYERNKPTLGKVKLTDFAKDFVKAFNQQMKAVRIQEFGKSEVMKIEEIERPVPAADEILVKVYASGVNPVDWVIRNGGNDFLKPLLKLPMILGWDAAGIVEEIGSNVTDFKKGDEVYGVPNFPGDGSYAEYLAAKASQFALKPKSISFNESASVPLAALTAWTGIFECGKLQSGQRILIHGSAGGVGSFALQFAKWKGAYVIGTASANNHDFLKQLGADEVIDYRNQKFEDLLRDIDVVFDASPLRDNGERIKSVNVLKEGGILVSTHADFPFSDDVTEALAKKNAKGEIDYVQIKQEWLNQIAQLIDESKVKVTISKIYPLEQVAKAHQESETWHVRGKLVLEVRKVSENA